MIKGEKWEFALNDLNDAIEYLSSQLKQKLNLRQLKYEKHTFIDKKEVLVKKVTDNNNKEKDSHVIVNKENQEEELDFKSENEEIKEREKVRMLYISACPDDEEDTLISSELAAFQKGIEKSKQEVEQLPPKTQTLANDLFEILKDNINNNTYLHISVHGYINYLAFINNKIEKTLAKINLFDIDSYFDILTIKPKIVLFSACNSYEFAKKTAQYVPFTIGTTGAIPIRAANLLTEYFYSIVINSGLSAIVFAFEYAVRCIERAKEELGKHSHAHLSEEIDAYLMPQLYINKKLVVQIYPNFLIDYTDKINQNKQIHII